MGALPAYTRRGQPLEGPSSLPSGSAQAATYDPLGQFEGWVSPVVQGDTLTLSGSQDGSTVIAANANGNLTITTTTDTGVATPGMIFDAGGTASWGNNQRVYSFRKNGGELFYIDGLGSVVIGAASSGGFVSLSTNPSTGGQCYIGNGMRRSSNEAGMQFYYGSAMPAATPGFMTAPISGTHTGAGIIAAFYQDSAKMIPRFVVYADGSIGMPGLPTSDPLVAGRLWNNSGVLNVSAG